MNTINRVVVVVVLAVLAILCCVLSVGAKWIVPVIAEQLNVLAGSLDSLSPVAALIIGAAIGLASVFVLVCLIILEIRPPKAKFIRVEKATGGEVELDASSIVDRLKQEVDALPGVISVRPKIAVKRNGVVVDLKADVAEGLDLPIQGERIADTIRKVVEDTIGLKMAKLPKVSLRTVRAPTAQPKKPAAVEKRPSAEPEKSPPALPEVKSYSIDSSDDDSFA
jgi:uncharacterized alkaline shock family protein YloU